MLHDGRHALVVDPGDGAPGTAARDAQRLARNAILVIQHHADPIGDIGVPRPPLRGPVYGRRRDPISQPGVALDDGDVIDTPALARAARRHDACSDEPVPVLAAPRHWKNDFR